ncbi:uncharacterized protein PG986_001709 [Apiospora aurea]|uniref:Uncharacterized protein n=1 Tax=Apiospora aurea TaxID=335848 RepID=A0ABR1QXL1_9PEZI
MDQLNVSGSMSAIHIKNTPQLGSRDSSQLQLVYDTTYKEGVWLHDAGSVQFPNLTSTDIVTAIDTNAEFPRLGTVSTELYVTNPNMGHTSFRSLAKASTFCFGNASVGSDSVLGYPRSTDLVVQQSMVIGPMSDGSDSKQPPVNIVNGNLELNQLAKVGEDLNITGNRGIVGFSFERLGDVNRLNIMDNPNSTISLNFPRLTSAKFNLD